MNTIINLSLSMKSKMNEITERQVQTECLDILNIYGFEAIRINSGMVEVQGKKRNHKIRLAPAGTSDIIACAPDGVFWAVEIKRPGNEPTERQMKFLEKIDERKGVAVWTDSSEWLEGFVKEKGFKRFVM